MFGEDLYVVLLDDGRDFNYLVLKLYNLFLDSVALMNNIYLLIYIGTFMYFDNEVWTILVVVVCHMI